MCVLDVEVIEIQCISTSFGSAKTLTKRKDIAQYEDIFSFNHTHLFITVSGFDILAQLFLADCNNKKKRILKERSRIHMKLIIELWYEPPRACLH